MLRLLLVSALLSIPSASALAQAADPTPSGVVFEIAYPSEGADERPISARVYVMLAAGDSTAEPRLGPNWFNPQPFFARDVENWRPGETVRIDGSADGFPGSLDELEPGQYRAQAVVRLNPDTAKIGTGEGNLHGPVVAFEAPRPDGGPIELTVNQVVPPRPFRETSRIKLAECPSPLLSEFYGRPIRHRAAVILPAVMPDHKLPTVYIITGFGGDHHSAERMIVHPGLKFAENMIRVVLDADCGNGHSTFADSANNGPRGRALVEEFIPYLEKTFPMIADPRARLLNGHSSGGWTSLWLQVNYPETFGGAWSTSPDPVDFRDFQRMNLYREGENFYRDPEGERRPLARMGTRPILFHDLFAKMETVMGHGGQLGSFEAVFSPKGEDGKPRKLWDRETGAIDPETAKAWEAYDIRLIMERNWPTLGPKLAGKIHVFMGTLDTFYLEGAVELLKGSHEKLGSDAEIEMIPGKDHSNVLDAALAEKIDRQMQAAVAPVFQEE